MREVSIRLLALGDRSIPNFPMLGALYWTRIQFVSRMLTARVPHLHPSAAPTPPNSCTSLDKMSIHTSVRLTGSSQLCFLLLIALTTFSAPAQPPNVPRIVFLGDSITHSGGFIESIEAATLVQFPELRIEFLNLGLPSETTSGLSEPGHAGGAFPRPDLHERLERVLEQTKPPLIVACYGMNDGIYYPFGDDRFEKFKSGIERLHQAAERYKCQIIHLTPAYFDALPIRDRLLPAGLDEYRQPFVGYDDVLHAYSEWLLGKRNAGWQVLDVHSTMKQAVAELRKSKPDFTFATDGVHPNDMGQAVIAKPLADAWGLKLGADGKPNHPRAAELLKLVREKQSVLKLAWLTATKHTRPGIPAGLSIQDAQNKAADLDRKARLLLTQP